MIKVEKMVQFCTNCGTKLGDEDNFCMNCGTKLNNNFSSSIPKSNIQNIQITQTEKKEAKKELKRITGRFGLNTSFTKTMRSNGLTIEDGLAIQGQLKKEINSGEIKSGGVETRINQLISKYKKENEIKNNRVPYIENIIKESCPNIELASFEKNYINNLKLNGLNIEQTKEKLNEAANKIINAHKKIGKYDFAGLLIEDGGFTNRVDIVTYQKNLRKDSDFMSNVYLKIFENNIKIEGSEFLPFTFRPRTGIDMTIFFRDITIIDYSNNDAGEININLSNKTKLRLKAYRGDEKYIENFYKLLKNAWENFKNNEDEKNTSINEEVSPSDELMKYAELYEKGLLTEEEFSTIKKKLLEL